VLYDFGVIVTYFLNCIDFDNEDMYNFFTFKLTVIDTVMTVLKKKHIFRRNSKLHYTRSIVLLSNIIHEFYFLEHKKYVCY